MNAVVIAAFVNVAIVLDVAGKEGIMEVPILAAMDVTVTVTPVIVVRDASKSDGEAPVGWVMSSLNQFRWMLEFGFIRRLCLPQ